VVLGARQSARGHFETYSFQGQIHLNTPDQTYWNQSWWHFSTMWGPQFRINRNVPNGTQICSRFWEMRNGNYINPPHSPACETVHS